MQSDPNHCGAPNNHCGGDRCELGSCVNDCNMLPDSCGDACVDLDTDPLNCGDCGDSCNAAELCINGSCRQWVPGPGCNACPCPGSCQGDCDQGCLYTGATNLVLCVDAGQCPSRRPCGTPPVPVRRPGPAAERRRHRCR